MAIPPRYMYTHGHCIPHRCICVFFNHERGVVVVSPKESWSTETLSWTSGATTTWTVVECWYYWCHLPPWTLQKIQTRSRERKTKRRAAEWNMLDEDFGWKELEGRIMWYGRYTTISYIDIMCIYNITIIYIHIYIWSRFGKPPPTPPQCNVPILTPFRPSPLWMWIVAFLVGGKWALVLALPHNDRCGVIRVSQRRGAWMGQTKWSS